MKVKMKKLVKIHYGIYNIFRYYEFVMNNGKIFIILFILLLSTVSADARLLQPWQYKDGQCELIAKHYQTVYGGYLIFIQPLKDSGAYDLGPYNGHFLNKAYNKEMGTYYIDYQSQTYFNNTDEILHWYYMTKGKKAEIFNVNERHPPFNIIWHY